MPYKNKADFNAWMRQYRRSRRSYFNLAERRTIAKKPAAYRAKWRRNTERLADCYVRQQLSYGTDIKRSSWPAWLVELKRLALQLKRKYGINQSHRRRTE